MCNLLLFKKTVKTCKIIIAILFVFSFLNTACFADKIAVITRSNIIPYNNFLEGFNDAFENSESEKHVLKVFSVNKKNGTEEEFVKEISLYQPDVILSIGTGALRISGKYFPDVPCVYSMVLNPEGIVKGDDYHAIGISMQVGIDLKLKILNEIMKDIKIVGTVYDPSKSSVEIKKARDAAHKLSIKFDALPVSSSKESINAIKKVMGRVDLFIIVFDSTVLMTTTVKYLLAESFRRKIPVFGVSEKYVKLGALLSANYNPRDIGAQAWHYIKLCMQDFSSCHGLYQPEVPVNITINKKIANKMNIPLSKQILKKASQVYGWLIKYLTGEKANG